MDDIKFLKAKCNKLIDRAIELEKVLNQRQEIVEQLKQEKSSLEERIQQQKDFLQQQKEEDLSRNAFAPVETEMEPIPNLKTAIVCNEDDKDVCIENTNIVTYEKVLEMIQTIGNQIDNRPMEEIVVRKLTFGGKVIELLQDITGKILKLLLLGGLMLLVSLAVTVLLNSDLRNMLMDFIKNCVG